MSPIGVIKKTDKDMNNDLLISKSCSREGFEVKAEITVADRVGTNQPQMLLYKAWHRG